VLAEIRARLKCRPPVRAAAASRRCAQRPTLAAASAQAGLCAAACAARGARRLGVTPPAGRGRGSAFCALVVELLTFFKGTYHRVFRMPDPPLHDPCAVAAVLWFPPAPLAVVPLRPRGRMG